MKSLQETPVQVHRSIELSAESGKEFQKSKSPSFIERIKLVGIPDRLELLSHKSFLFLEDIKSIGIDGTMDDLERRKLSIFNQLNFFQLVTGLVVPISFFFGKHDFPVFAFFIASLPSCVSLLVLSLNFYYKYQAGMIAYFLLYPVITSIVYMRGMNLGVDLFFILYGVLSVFFLQEISHMLFSVALSMVSYFILVIINKTYTYQLQTSNLFFYLFNQFTAILFIFYGLYLIKKENTLYQVSILSANRTLQEKNDEIEKQKAEIEENAKELVELNSLKNKLFSVIAHDLKSPMYALRNLFSQMQQQDMPLKEIKSMIPDVVNDLNYTTGLMENLLQWAKSQMQSGSINPQPIDTTSIIHDVINTLHLQATSKKIIIKNKVKKTMVAYADPDMVQLVLRNLVSNAIKFTPQNGQITICADEQGSFITIGVEDTGIGITEDEIAKINDNSYYTTKGTSSEAGTGLGLMLCKEFINKNGGSLHISSVPRKGSKFSFTLPKE